MSFDHEAEWPGLRALAEAGASNAILEQIKACADDAERVSLYRFTIRKLAFGEWDHKNLDVMTAVADAAIRDCEELGGDYLQQANVICFNTSANLADCWDDDFPRESRHFEKGIEYARKALWFREHLGKGPGSLAMATWALGKHQQSLGLDAEARASFARSLELEALAAAESGKVAALSEGAPSGYLIAAGYVAMMDRDQSTLSSLAQVLEEMLRSGGEEREEAEIIALQLRATGRKMGIDFMTEAAAKRSH